MPSKQLYREKVLTKQKRIAEVASKHPEKAILSVNQYIDLEWLYVAYLDTRKDGAKGIDEVGAKEYSEKLKENLESLLNRLKSGNYRAPAVKRVYIPKGNGETRPLGIPTFEDKILQRAVKMAIEPIFERDFYDFSHGFRKGHSPHGALNHLREGIMRMYGGWIIDLDISKYFDSIDHTHLREMYKQKVCDGVITRVLGKWLKAGIMDDGQLSYNEFGTPQGGVISPLLSNLYLHEVLDDWFVKVVQPRLKGCSFMIRFADDATLVFEHEEDARRVIEVLPKRFAKYALNLNERKTRLVKFDIKDKDNGRPESFDYLGFTLYWGKSRKGNDVVKWKTRKGALSKAIKSVYLWCKENRHKSVAWQHRKLVVKLKGHYNYYGLTFNSRSLNNFYYHCVRSWHYWLSRRSEKSYINWDKFNMMLKHYVLPTPRIVHSAC